jgi:hypothetical protein
MPFDLFGDALDSGSAGNQMIERTAFRTGLGRPFGMAALVALQLATKPMLDEPAGALRALEAMTAYTAKGQGRVAAAIEEQERLVAAFDGLAHSAQQNR